MNSDNLEVISKELSTIHHEITNLKNKEYNLNKKYTELFKEKCRENIGRCFKKMKEDKVISYCRIIDIDQETHFNEYQYPALWFEYPYNDSNKPFYADNLFSGAWGKGNDFISDLKKISYAEISKEEFLEKFKEINDLWISKISE